MKIQRRQRAQNEENELLGDLHEELVHLAKPDLCNEAEKLGVATTGTKRDLRHEIMRERVRQWREANYPDISLGEIDVKFMEAEEEEEKDVLLPLSVRFGSFKVFLSLFVGL